MALIYSIVSKGGFGESASGIYSPLCCAAGGWWERALLGQPGIARGILAKSFLNSLSCNLGEILTLVGSCTDH